MPEEIDWLEKHSNASMVIFNIAHKIEYIAKGFKTTGNNIVYNSLMTMAQDIREANKDMRNAIGESIKETIVRSGESTKAVLEVALASIMMENRLHGGK